MKKVIALLICLILCIGLFSTLTYADDPTTIITTIDEESFTYGPVVILPNGQRIIFNPPVQTTPTPTPTITQRRDGVETTKIDDSKITIPKEAAQEQVIVEEDLKKEIFEQTNKKRVEYDLSTLEYCKEIQDAADLRAKEISEYFSHTRPNGTTCYTAFDFMDYFIAGENLIMADNPLATAEIMLDTWMNSEGHRDNILLADFTSMAVGVYVKNDVTYAVQIFLG